MQKKSKYNVAIVGATGAVGVEFLKLLEDRDFPIDELRLLASPRSKGKKVIFCGREIEIQVLTPASFENIDIALFSAGGSISKEYAPHAVKAGAVVIDNSSAFRKDESIPLVVPEINPQEIFKHQGIIANPNCTTIIMGVALWPLHQANPIKRIDVATYQAVSGAGAQALEELRLQQQAILRNEEPVARVLKYPIVNNLFSHNSDMTENGYNQEEMKMVYETQRIFGEERLEINPTCIRVPIERAHSEALHVTFSKPMTLTDAQQILSKSQGVTLVDSRSDNYFPMPLLASGQNNVFVGRLREDLFDKTKFALFVCGDQLLKGAALNAVQIAEVLIA